jgi:DNA-binding IscR family transcriptional regulator
MHNGSCEGVEMNKKRCPLHEDYEKARQELIQLFSKRTIFELVKIATNVESIAI